MLSFEFIINLVEFSQSCNVKFIFIIVSLWPQPIQPIVLLLHDSDLVVFMNKNHSFLNMIILIID